MEMGDNLPPIDLGTQTCPRDECALEQDDCHVPSPPPAPPLSCKR